MHLTEGKYRIKNVKTSTALDETIDDSHLIHGWQQTNADNQHWLIERPSKSPDCFTMKNLASGLYAYVDGAYNGCQLRGSSDPTIWFLDLQADGSVSINYPHTDYLVELDNGNMDNGTIIHMSEKHLPGEPQQKWYFEQIN
ncbi:hypothetical protein OPQ81_010980 [Rhizoctonia solani]|nr:hypothetical protein OPQ81_010980 [Rhizoctonia solani]